MKKIEKLYRKNPADISEEEIVASIDSTMNQLTGYNITITGQIAKKEREIAKMKEQLAKGDFSAHLPLLTAMREQTTLKDMKASNMALIEEFSSEA